MKRILISVLLAGFAGSGAYAADFASLNVSVDQFKAAAAENTAVAVPNMPKVQTITVGKSEFAGLSVLPGKIKSERPLTKGKTAANDDVTGDVSGLVHGVALHNPSLRNIPFLAMTGSEVMEFRGSPTQHALLENMRATALCGFLGFGRAIFTTVTDQSVERIQLLTIEPSGALAQNNYEPQLRFDVSHYIKYYPTYLAEVVCAPKGQ